MMEDNNAILMVCEDVVVEILCRLPGKDLIRCKCVCKAWHRLICEVCIPRVSVNPPLSFLSLGIWIPDDDDYSTVEGCTRWFRHLNVKKQEGISGPARFVLNSRVALPFRDPADCLLNSCDGLFLFHTHTYHRYYVCNPTTEEVVMLLGSSKHTKCCLATLAFDPCKSPHYKVVRFASSGETRVLMDLYSSESRRWAGQMLPVDNLVPFKSWYKHMVFFDGKIYCLSTKGCILRFDLNVAENGRRMPIPGAKREKRCPFLYPGILGTSMRHLCYAKLHTDGLNLWLLSNECEGGQWILKYKVTFDFEKEVPLYAKDPFGGLVFFSPLGFHPNSDVVFIGTPRMILTYDFKSNTLKEVGRAREGMDFSHPVYTHVQCLVSLANSEQKFGKAFRFFFCTE